MERAEQLKFCRICKERRMDIKQGIACGLTGLRADFEGTCPSYREEPALKKRWEADVRSSNVAEKTVDSGKRLVNYILDRIFGLTFVVVFSIVLGIVLGMVAPETIQNFDGESLLLNYLISFVALMIYYIAFEASTGRTPAKYITKTKVVNAMGEKPDFGTIVVRSLCRFIPFEAFSFFGSDNRGWHDRFSETYVVEA